MQNYFNSLWLHVAKSIESLERLKIWPMSFLINMLTALKGFQFYNKMSLQRTKRSLYLFLLIVVKSLALECLLGTYSSSA